MWHTPLLHFTFETLSHYLPKIFSGSQFWFHLATSMPAVFLISKVATSLPEIFVCCYCISGAIITWSSSHRPYKNKEMEKKQNRGKMQREDKNKKRKKKNNHRSVSTDCFGSDWWRKAAADANALRPIRNTPYLFPIWEPDMCKENIWKIWGKYYWKILGTRLTYFPFGKEAMCKKILGKYYSKILGKYY